jgi:hypothetical protein
MPTTLRLVTPGRHEHTHCSRTYTCSCHTCVFERAQAVARGVRPAKHQPWEPREARAA